MSFPVITTQTLPQKDRTIKTQREPTNLGKKEVKRHPHRNNRNRMIPIPFPPSLSHPRAKNEREWGGRENGMLRIALSVTRLILDKLAHTIFATTLPWGKTARVPREINPLTPYAPMFLMPVAGANHTGPLRAVPAVGNKSDSFPMAGAKGVKIPPNFSFAGGISADSGNQNRGQEISPPRRGFLSCVAKKRSIGGDGA